MNSLKYLASRGVCVWIKPNGNLGLKGLSNLGDLERKEAIQWVRENKDDLIEKITCANKAKKANKDAEELLWRVSAHVRRGPDGEAITFDPPLAGPTVDPERWKLAKELEDLFFRGLLSSTEETDFQNNKIPARKKVPITKLMLSAWKTSRPWLLDRLPELQTYGWTRTKLFRAGRYKYPCGPWGVAFSRNWLRPDVQVCIVPEDGAIRWTWTEPSGRTVSQAARPRVQSIQEKI